MAVGDSSVKYLLFLQLYVLPASIQSLELSTLLELFLLLNGIFNFFLVLTVVATVLRPVLLLISVYSLHLVTDCAKMPKPRL